MRNKFVLLLAAILCFGGLDAFAQTGRSGDGPRHPANLTSFVEVVNGCEHSVVTFNGVAQTRVVTSGRGVLAGIEIVSVTEGNATVVPWKVAFYDAASVSDVTITTPSLGNADKIISDQYGGPLALFDTPVSNGAVGSAFSATSLGSTRNNPFLRPITFKKGIVIDHGSTANHGSMTIYWLR